MLETWASSDAFNNSLVEAPLVICPILGRAAFIQDRKSAHKTRTWDSGMETNIRLTGLQIGKFLLPAVETDTPSHFPEGNQQQSPALTFISHIDSLRTDSFNFFHQHHSTSHFSSGTATRRSGCLRISQLPGGMATATAALNVPSSEGHARRRAL